MTAFAHVTPRGEFVDIGGRKMRIVCEGPADGRPTVLMEAGAFGFSADFGAIQQALTAKGVRSCAYDRAGLGWSDPGPAPRDSLAIVSDLEKLLAAKGEQGPFILMGHSMAGLHTRLFAARNPGKIAGLVLIEAATPESLHDPAFHKFVRSFAPASTAVAVLTSAGLLKPLKGRMGDRIGLPPEASAEKRWAFGSGRHARTAAAEVRNWVRSSQEAGAAAPYDPRWPVAVILAGNRGESLTSSRGVPAGQAIHGSFVVVGGAQHATVLNAQWNSAIIDGVEFVLAHPPVH